MSTLQMTISLGEVVSTETSYQKKNGKSQYEKDESRKPFKTIVSISMLGSRVVRNHRNFTHLLDFCERNMDFCTIKREVVFSIFQLL